MIGFGISVHQVWQLWINSVEKPTIIGGNGVILYLHIRLDPILIETIILSVNSKTYGYELHKYPL